MTLEVYSHLVPSGPASGAAVLAGQLSAEWRSLGKVPAVTASGTVRNSRIDIDGRDRHRTCDPFHVNELDPDPSEPTASQSKT